MVTWFKLLRQLNRLSYYHDDAKSIGYAFEVGRKLVEIGLDGQGRYARQTTYRLNNKTACWITVQITGFYSLLVEDYLNPTVIGWRDGDPFMGRFADNKE